MYRTDEQYGDYPTLEEIKRDYNELMELVGNITTVKQAKDVWKNTPLTVEINGIFADKFSGTDSEIVWIRYEAYGCLSYVYVYLENSSIKSVIFDVWSNKWNADFIGFATIERVEKNYDAFLSQAETDWKNYGGVA